MWELEYKDSWVLKSWCFLTVMLEKTLESPMDYKGIQPVNPKGNQSWIFTGRTDAEAETPILWLPDAKSWLIGKDPDAEKDWGQEEKGTTEGEMAGWHHWLDGHEFGWALGVGDEQGGLVCCSSWGCNEPDTTEQLNWTEMFFWNSLAFSVIQRMLAIWSLVPLPFLNPAWTSGSSQFMYCWSLAWRILSIALLVGEMNAVVVLKSWVLELNFVNF